jgi:hypothetical protein
LFLCVFRPFSSFEVSISFCFLYNRAEFWEGRPNPEIILEKRPLKGYGKRFFHEKIGRGKIAGLEKAQFERAKI